MPRMVNQATITLIKTFEGCKLVAYPDNGEMSIGYGHRGAHIQEGDTITQETADALLQTDVERVANEVDDLVHYTVSDNQFGALVSFCYNLGIGTLQRSSLLSKLNSHDIAGAADEFLKWVKIKGVPSQGLLRRREAERQLFLS